MLSSYLAAAWRSFLRDRLYALINIVGLAIGLSAALLSGLYIHNELTFERFLPGYEHRSFSTFSVSRSSRAIS